VGEVLEAALEGGMRAKAGRSRAAA
jgi:hypothetical protein